MRGFRMFALSAVALLPVLSSAQIKRELVGKWVVDREKMSEVDPAWDGVLSNEMWIVTSFKDGRFFISRSGGGIESYDPSGASTTVPVGGREAVAEAHWEGDRLVVRMTVSGVPRAFTRTIYREGHWLVIEEEGRPQTRWERTFFVKS